MPSSAWAWRRRDAWRSRIPRTACTRASPRGSRRSSRSTSTRASTTFAARRWCSTISAKSISRRWGRCWLVLSRRRTIRLKAAHRLGELAGGGRELPRGGSQLAERRDLTLGGGRRLLRTPRRRVRDGGRVEHALGHLADPPGLPLGLGRERGGEPGGGVQVREDRLERLPPRRRDGAHPFRRAARLLHRSQQRGGLILDSLDARPHLVARARALLGQLAHLGRHDPEPEPALAGAGGLDRRVQGEEVGLARDAGDAVHELADLARPLLQRPDGPGHLGHVLDQGGEQLPRARDLVAVTARLLGDRADLLLRFLGARVQGGGHARRRVRFLPPLADQRTLPLRAFGEVLGGDRDLL